MMNYNKALNKKIFKVIISEFEKNDIKKCLFFDKVLYLCYVNIMITKYNKLRS